MERVPKGCFSFSDQLNWDKRSKNGKNERRQKVGDLDLFAENEIDADAKNENITDDRKIKKCAFGHNRLYENRERRHAALQDRHGNGGKDRTFSE